MRTTKVKAALKKADKTKPKETFNLANLPSVKPQTMGKLEDIFHLRIVKGWSELQIKEYLMKEYDFTERHCQGLISKMRQLIMDNINYNKQELMAQKIEEYERTSAELKQNKNYKMWLELEKEKNKLMGLYEPQKIDVTTNGSSINSITAINITVFNPTNQKYI